MSDDINYTVELSPFEMVFWWFVKFLFGSSGTLTEVIVTLVMMVLVAVLVGVLMWKFCAWVGRTHRTIVDSNH